MKPLLPPTKLGSICRKTINNSRRLLALCLTIIGLTVAAGTTYGLINHPPSISFIGNQAITTGTQFATAYFRAWDNETTLQANNFTYTVENDSHSTNFYTGAVHITPCSGEAGCASDGTGFKLTFVPLAHGDGAATIRITVTDGTLDSIQRYSAESLGNEPELLVQYSEP